MESQLKQRRRNRSEESEEGKSLIEETGWRQPVIWNHTCETGSTTELDSKEKALLKRADVDEKLN